MRKLKRLAKLSPILKKKAISDLQSQGPRAGRVGVQNGLLPQDVNSLPQWPLPTALRYRHLLVNDQVAQGMIVFTKPADGLIMTRYWTIQQRVGFLRWRIFF